MMSRPETPVDHSISVRVTEDCSREISQIVSLGLLIGHIDVELGSGNWPVERAKPVEDLQHALGWVERGPEMSLHSDPVDRSPICDQVIEGRKESVLIHGIGRIGVEDSEFVDHEKGLRIMLASQLEPM